MTGALLAGKAGTDEPAVHALVIGVSRYDHLPGGEGPLSAQPFTKGLTQLGAAASSAARIAIWLRDRLDYPDTPLGSLRFLASPSAGEVPLPGGLEPPPATYAEVKAALVEWRDDARRNAANVSVLFVAGHGFQIGNAGGILLLQDFGRSGAVSVMEQTLDVVGVQKGMLNDPNDPQTFTPAVQYYFHDACRIMPAASDAYVELSGGLRLDMPKGLLPKASWAYFGARSRDFAYGDPATRATLFSEAIMHCLDQPEYVDTDGRTILCSMFGSQLEKTVEELAAAYEAQQLPTSEGAGSSRAPVHRRPTRRRRRLRGGGDPNATPTARRTVQITAGPNPLAVEVRGPGGAVLADGVTGEAFDVPLGRYDAVIRRPWGGDFVHPFTVGAGEGPLRIDVDLPADADTEPSAGGLRDQPRLERQLRAPARSGSDDVDRGEASATGWYLRFLSWQQGGFAPLPPGMTPPAVTVDSVDDGQVAMTVRSQSPHLHYVQVRDAAGQSLVSALPVTRGGPEAHTCRLYVRAGGGLGAVVRLADGESDRVAGYLELRPCRSGRRHRHVRREAPALEDAGSPRGGPGGVRAASPRRHRAHAQLARQPCQLVQMAPRRCRHRGCPGRPAPRRPGCRRPLPRGVWAGHARVHGRDLGARDRGPVPAPVGRVAAGGSGRAFRGRGAAPGPVGVRRLRRPHRHPPNRSGVGRVQGRGGVAPLRPVVDIRRSEQLLGRAVSDPLFRLHVLPAGVGDALVVEYGEGQTTRRLLVDGGVGSAAEAVHGFLGDDAALELLVVTHIDNDHIAGALRLLETGAAPPKPAQVWFNAYRHLPETKLQSMGPVEGERLTTHIVEQGYPWNTAFESRAVMIGTDGPPPERPLDGGIRLTVLSPGHDELAELRKKWAPVVQEGGLDPAVAPPPEPAPVAGLERMGGLDVATLSAQTTPEDTTVANGSTIVLLATWAGRTCLLAGDAHPKVLLRGIDQLVGPGDVLDVDVFKLPHHGSKANVTLELVRRVRASVYVFSSNGAGNSRHPNDEAVARVIAGSSGDRTLAFNYRNERTLKWDDESLRTQHGYTTMYPAAGEGPLSIDLCQLPPRPPSGGGG